MVLDNTGSMAGAKIAALKKAAKELVTNLSATVVSADQVKFSLVPFGRYVNIGLANHNQ